MQRSKLISTALLTIAAMFAVAGGSAAHAQGAATVLKLAHGSTAEHANGKGILKFAELVGTMTGGRVKIETHMAGSLYSERTSLEAMMNGAIDIGGASNANWAAFTNTLIFMDLPYVFNDEASFRKVLDGPVGKEIRNRLEKEGFKILMVMELGGFRDLVNTKKPIHVPSDLKGLKFRTSASPVEIAMLRNWGAITTAIDWAEVYNAIGSGVVDGEFSVATWLSLAKHYEVLKYATLNKAVIGITTLAMRKDRFDKLPAAVQTAVLAAAAEAQAYSDKQDVEQRAGAYAHARKYGVQIYTPTADEMKIWRATGREIWKQFDAKVDKALLKMVLDAQAQ